MGEKETVTSATLATKDSCDFLNNLDPVVGITGSAGGHRRALQQFNTPGFVYPVGQREPDEVYDEALALFVIEPAWLRSPECHPRHLATLVDACCATRATRPRR